MTTVSLRVGGGVCTALMVIVSYPDCPLQYVIAMSWKGSRLSAKPNLILEFFKVDTLVDAKKCRAYFLGTPLGAWLRAWLHGV
jgi:hypothetical protein